MGLMELNILVIKGIGDLLIYFVDCWCGKNGVQLGVIGDISIYDVDFELIFGVNLNLVGYGFIYIDYLMYNVYCGCMQEWVEFYECLFNFCEVCYFDIEGKVIGVKLKVMMLLCGKICILINEEGLDMVGQIQEYFDVYYGEGIQYIVFGVSDIYQVVDGLCSKEVKLFDMIDMYYELVDCCVLNYGELLVELKKCKILIDGVCDDLLLQIFIENQIGLIFFEIIQCKGNQGFGEGNFKVLFELIEFDQICCGVVQDKV